jgi:RNA polymerase sigma-70 factor (ECF subfamily)
MGASREDAEDVVSLTLLRVYRAIDTVHSDGALDRWVLRIAHNACIDTLRRSGGPSRPVPFTCLGPVGDEDRRPDPAKTPPDVLIEKEQVSAVLRTANSLPREQRSPFLLFYCDGRTYTEIAACEHIPIGTVKSRLNRARAEVKKRLAA